jgi:hypothetical protein
MTTEELRDKENRKRQALYEIDRCNNGAIALAVNGYISKWQYKRIIKKLTKAWKEANKPLYENDIVFIEMSKNQK